MYPVQTHAVKVLQNHHFLRCQEAWLHGNHHTWNAQEDWKSASRLMLWEVFCHGGILTLVSLWIPVVVVGMLQKKRHTSETEHTNRGSPVTDTCVAFLLRDIWTHYVIIISMYDAHDRELERDDNDDLREKCVEAQMRKAGNATFGGKSKERRDYRESRRTRPNTVTLWNDCGSNWIIFSGKSID